ncbi:MAG TPA: hypothetical protein VFB67_08225 [Candidatus Polarisedimenticolaceae bacterium]|nr:hypothetical protein [Candidatus Polarisedimenticolaceae bacterium]
MKGRSLITVIGIAALAAAGAALADEHAGHHDAKADTVQGEVLDLACYIGHGGEGAGHAGCAAKCLQGGQPMGLLAKDGAVYVLLADHDDAAPYEKTKTFAGKKVEITGEVGAKNGIKGITVHGVKAL